MSGFPIFNPPADAPADPPPYGSQQQRRDSVASTTTSASGSVPYKRVKDMTPDERLASLREWAEEQKYFRPGQGGTFGYGGFANPTVYSGPVRYTEPSYQGWIAPPSYDSAQASADASESRAADDDGKLKKWLKKRKEQKLSRCQSAPEAQR